MSAAACCLVVYTEKRDKPFLIFVQKLNPFIFD